MQASQKKYSHEGRSDIRSRVDDTNEPAVTLVVGVRGVFAVADTKLRREGKIGSIAGENGDVRR